MVDKFKTMIYNQFLSINFYYDLCIILFVKNLLLRSKDFDLELKYLE